MKKDVYSFFNIERVEKVSVLLFLIQSVFLGIFYGAFDVGAHALFLGIYPASAIPKAYVLSGVLGIVLTTIYARLQNRYNFSTLAIINLIFISLSAAFLRLLFQFTESPWLIFLIFIMMGPLNIIALLGFWGAVGRMFTLRQGKRLFGLIDSGQIFGAILSTFAIPVLINIGFEQKNLLLLSSVSVACALALQIIISIKFKANLQIQKKEKRKNKLPVFIKNKYVLHMSVFVIMSMLAAFFIQYSFLSVTKDNFPDHNNLTEFLGAFTGSLLLFTFLFKTFVYSKLMKAYGLKVSIIISSFLLSIFTLIAILLGSLSGYTSVSSGFVFFFLIISLTRLFSKALKDAVEVPSFKILYQSLKAEIRHDVQAYVDGTINELAALAAGLILAALSLFEFFKLIHFSYTLIIILVIWFFVARRLYLEYKVSLEKSLADYKGKKEEIENISDFMDENLNDKSSDRNKILVGLNYDFSLHPIKFEEKINHLLNSDSKEVQNFVRNKIIDNKIVNLFPLADKTKMTNGTVENVISEEFKQVDLTIEKSPGIDKLIALSKSKSIEDRITVSYLIAKFYEKGLFVPLKALIRDLNLSVRIAAIKAAVSTKKREFCPLITDYIDSPELVSYVYDALLQYGQEALESIDQVFYKTGTNHKTLLRAVRLIGEIGGKKAHKLLLKKLDHTNEEILNQVLISLKQSGFQADENDLTYIHQIIDQHVGVIAWNIAAKSTLDEISGFQYLKDALHDEFKANYDLLYLLLSLAYDSKSIMHVKENIESGTTEGISFALELLDLFISDDIKPKLFPIVEDISDTEKIRQLQNFYPVEKLSLEELLTAIINRNINHTNIWTKACALYAFSEFKGNDISDDLLAHLFNPHEVLRETAAYSVLSIDNKKFDSIVRRMGESNGESFNDFVDSMSESKYHLLVEKTWFLKTIEYFENVDGRYLLELAKNLTIFEMDSQEKQNIFLPDLKNKLIFIKGESAHLNIDNKKELELVSTDIYDMDEVLNDCKGEVSLSIKDKGSIFFIEKDELIYTIFDFYKIETAIIKWLSKNN